MTSSQENTIDCLSSLEAVAGIVTKQTVIVHPIVLLSVVDHYSRVAKGTSRRVVGVLLGEVVGDQIHVGTSFAVPFDEDSKDERVYFLDSNYVEYMYIMYKKVNTKDMILGWYSIGSSSIKANDLHIHEIFRQYTQNPLYVIFNVNPTEAVVPFTAYYSYEMIQSETSANHTFTHTFVHAPCTIGSYEAEEVGVEHLLRDLKAGSSSVLCTNIQNKVSALEMLLSRLRLVAEYVADAMANKLSINPSIVYQIQEIFNLLPDMSQPALLKAFATATNDNYLALYICSLTQSVAALHNLIDNKIQNRRKKREALSSKKPSASVQDNVKAATTGSADK